MDDTAIAQEDVLAFLADPATYGGGTEKVRRIDTHAASVFLAGDRALKIKRAVRFPFLDYSTLEKRKRACEAEIEVNRRLAPKLYRGVVAITRESDGRLAIGGAGDRSNGRSTWCASTKTAPSIILPMRSTTTSPMRSAAPSPPRTIKRRSSTPSLGSSARLLYRRACRDVCRVPGNFSGRGCRSARRKKPRPLSAHRAAVARARPTRARSPHPRRSSPRQYRADRRRAGAVRRHRIQRHHRLGRRALRSRLSADGSARAPNCRRRPISCSTVTSPKRAGTKTSTRWRRCRSFCRCGPRSAPRSRRRGWSAPQRPSAPTSPSRREPISISPSVRSRRRRRNSSPSAACPAPARRGSPARWRRMSRRCPAPSSCARTSSERRYSAPARPKSFPRKLIAPEVTARLYAAFAEKARRIVAAGHSAIVDAVFATPQERDALAAAAKAAKIPLRGLFLTTDLATRIARVGGRRHDASDADAAVVQSQESYALGALTWPKIDASGTVMETLGRARAALSAEPRPGKLLD